MWTPTENRDDLAARPPGVCFATPPKQTAVPVRMHTPASRRVATELIVKLVQRVPRGQRQDAGRALLAIMPCSEVELRQWAAQPPPAAEQVLLDHGADSAPAPVPISTDQEALRRYTLGSNAAELQVDGRRSVPPRRGSAGSLGQQSALANANGAAVPFRPTRPPSGGQHPFSLSFLDDDQRSSGTWLVRCGSAGQVGDAGTEQTHAHAGQVRFEDDRAASGDRPRANSGVYGRPWQIPAPWGKPGSRASSRRSSRRSPWRTPSPEELPAHPPQRPGPLLPPSTATLLNPVAPEPELEPATFLTIEPEVLQRHTPYGSRRNSQVHDRPRRHSSAEHPRPHAARRGSGAGAEAEAPPKRRSSPTEITADQVRDHWNELSEQERRKWRDQQRRSTFRRARERARSAHDERAPGKARTATHTVLRADTRGPEAANGAARPNAQQQQQQQPLVHRKGVPPRLTIRGKPVVGNVLKAELFPAPPPGFGGTVVWHSDSDGVWDELTTPRGLSELPLTRRLAGARIRCQYRMPTEAGGEAPNSGMVWAATNPVQWIGKPGASTPRRSVSGAVVGQLVAGHAVACVPPGKAGPFSERPRWYCLPDHRGMGSVTTIDASRPVAVGDKLDLLQRHVGWRVRVAYTCLGREPEECVAGPVCASPAPAAPLAADEPPPPPVPFATPGDPKPCSAPAAEAVASSLSQTSQSASRSASPEFASARSLGGASAADFPGVSVWDDINVARRKPIHVAVPGAVPGLRMAPLRAWQRKAAEVLQDKLAQDAAAAKKKQEERDRKAMQRAAEQRRVAAERAAEEEHRRRAEEAAAAKARAAAAAAAAAAAGSPAPSSSPPPSTSSSWVSNSATTGRGSKSASSPFAGHASPPADEGSPFAGAFGSHHAAPQPQPQPAPQRAPLVTPEAPPQRPHVSAVPPQGGAPCAASGTSTSIDVGGTPDLGLQRPAPAGGGPLGRSRLLAPGREAASAGASEEAAAMAHGGMRDAAPQRGQQRQQPPAGGAAPVAAPPPAPAALPTLPPPRPGGKEGGKGGCNCNVM
eukprot:TRINITY_DN24281_c0_g1_i2.p1 TRINITY_DN24281_c0_g1~~TRINITY_DN24281_c0_g1_i2.p1  ORF type:complete len:1063 (+),score=267.67 TRINITY_DN24281_c0_g1_i2:67-3189(+)